MRDTKFGCMPRREKNHPLFHFWTHTPSRKKTIPFSIFGRTPLQEKNYPLFHFWMRDSVYEKKTI
jgi:hypothetical protein